MSIRPISFYNSTWGFNPHGLVFGCILCLLTAVVIGSIYGATELYNPNLLFRMFATCLSGAATGLAVGFIFSRMAHIRPKPPQVLLSLVFIIIGFIASWVLWIHAIIDWRTIIIQPLYYIVVIDFVYENGTWSHDRFRPPVNGMPLVFYWLVEFLGYVIPGVIGSAIPYKTTPYCLACRNYSEPYGKSCSLILPPDTAELARRIEYGDIDPLFDLETHASDDMVYLSVSLHHCEKCDNFRTASVDRIDISFDKKNNRILKTTPVVKTWLVDNASYGRLSGMIEAAEEIRHKMIDEMFAAQEQEQEQEQNQAQNQAEEQASTETQEPVEGQNPKQ